MNKDLLRLVVCPVDHAELTLVVDQTAGTDVVSGTLTCTQCKEQYLIVDSVPNMLPPETRSMRREIAQAPNGPEEEA